MPSKHYCIDCRHCIKVGNDTDLDDQCKLLPKTTTDKKRYYGNCRQKNKGFNCQDFCEQEATDAK